MGAGRSGKKGGPGDLGTLGAADSERWGRILLTVSRTGLGTLMRPVVPLCTDDYILIVERGRMPRQVRIFR